MSSMSCAHAKSANWEGRRCHAEMYSRDGECELFNMVMVNICLWCGVGSPLIACSNSAWDAVHVLFCDPIVSFDRPGDLIIYIPCLVPMRSISSGVWDMSCQF